MENKTMWCVKGVSIGKVEIVKETDKTYRVGNVEKFTGYYTVWPNSLVRKSDMDKQWFADRKDALACLVENQRQRVGYYEVELTKVQAQLKKEKETLAEWEAQFAFYEDAPNPATSTGAETPG